MSVYEKFMSHFYQGMHLPYSEFFLALMFWAILDAEAAFSDVTLVYEDKHPLAAHTVILSATSPFSRHLNEDAHNHPLIYVGD